MVVGHHFVQQYRVTAARFQIEKGLVVVVEEKHLTQRSLEIRLAVQRLGGGGFQTAAPTFCL